MIKKIIKPYDEFIAEGKLTLKRRYTDEHPAIQIYEKPILRNKILSYVYENGNLVSLIEFKNYLKSLEEDIDIGRVPSLEWLRQNKRYFKIYKINEKKYVTLSKYGQKVVKYLESKKEI